MIHHAPSNNCVDHGFYNFSPTFFYDYYTTNQFKIETIYYIEIETDFFKPINVFEYLPGYLELSSCGLFDPGKVGLTFVVARKTEKSTGNKYPTQSHYQEAWPELASSKQKKDHPPFFHDKYQRLMPRPIHLHPRLPPPPILPADGWIPDITRALFIEEQLLELPVKGLKTLSFRILFTILKRKFCALFIWPSPGESDAKIAAGKLLHGPRSELASVSFFILLKIFIRKLRLSILGRAK